MRTNVRNYKRKRLTRFLDVAEYLFRLGARDSTEKIVMVFESELLCRSELYSKTSLPEVVQGACPSFVQHCRNRRANTCSTDPFSNKQFEDRKKKKERLVAHTVNSGEYLTTPIFSREHAKTAKATRFDDLDDLSCRTITDPWEFDGCFVCLDTVAAVTQRVDG
jgi:hypothetical protein